MYLLPSQVNGTDFMNNDQTHNNENTPLAAQKTNINFRFVYISSNQECFRI